MSRVDEIRKQQVKRHADLERFGKNYVVGTVTLEDIDYLLSQLKDGGAEVDYATDIAVGQRWLEYKPAAERIVARIADNDCLTCKHWSADAVYAIAVELATCATASTESAATEQAGKQWPTEEEAEAILRQRGTSGKEVVNGFIDQVLRERLQFEEAIKTFIRERGRHEGEHVFDLTVCRLCDESYVQAEAALDASVESAAPAPLVAQPATTQRQIDETRAHRLQNFHGTDEEWNEFEYGAQPKADPVNDRCKCGLDKDDPIHSFSTEWRTMHRYEPCSTLPSTPAQDVAKEVVGTVFQNTAASHETLEATMIERVSDYLSKHCCGGRDAG